LAASLHKDPSLRWRWLLPAAVLVVVFHFSSFGGKALDYAFLDASSRQASRHAPVPGNSALVLVNDDTMRWLGQDPYNQRWPFARSYFAALLAALDRAGAERIVVDFTFLESSDAADDALLAAVASGSPKVVLARTKKQPPVFWNDAFVQAHASLFSVPRTGLVDFPSDEDGVARVYDAADSLAAAALIGKPVSPGGLLRWHGGLKQIEALGVPVVAAGHFFVAGLPIVDRLSQKVPDFSPEAMARALQAEPALVGPPGSKLAEAVAGVRGRIVFVGANASGTFDMKELPVGKLEPGVLLHWTAWTNLVANDFIVRIPRWTSLLVGGVMAALILLLAGRWPGLTVPAVAAIGFVILLLPAAYAALSAGWYFSPSTPAAASLVTLLGVAAESFWTERARKREMQALFGAYVDPGVVAEFVRDPNSIQLGGEWREATVFFSDLVGFTTLSEKLPAKQMFEVVNAYLEETSECLLNHGAYVDKYIGDAVMAVFGVPKSMPDHAVAACRAALAAQRLIDKVNARYAEAVGVRLDVRIGLNSGDLLVGNVGSSRKKSYTVMGDAVNLASRLEGANKAFGTGILIGDETARRVQGVLVTRPLARLRVKGKHQAVEVHTLLGAPADLSPTQRAFLDAYRTGYDAYVDARFAEAAEALARAAGILPGDLTTDRLRVEAARYELTSPPADWEPVLTLESK
jgi:adenylate cyclase